MRLEIVGRIGKKGGAASFVSSYSSRNNVEVDIEETGDGLVVNIDDEDAEGLSDALESAGFPVEQDDEPVRARRSPQPFFKLPKYHP